MRTGSSIVPLAAALALAACEERISLVPTGRGPAPTHDPAPPSPPSPAAPAAPPDAAPPPAGAPPPQPAAGDPPPAPAPQPPPAPSAAKLLRAARAVEPAGAELPLSAREETVVDPAATFRLELGAALEDARLVLLDKDDAIVPSKGSREIAATTTFTLAPAEPLVPGSRYVLRVDGARSRELHDAAGVAYAPFTLALLVAGEPPKPEPKPAPKKKRGRR
jgi:hypothetical protein